jgi:glucose dehydrogenase
MSLWGRDLDTGMAKWVYQMTPHDEWDYDGVNEVILAEQKVNGKMRKTAVHFDRNGFGYTMDRVTGELLVAEKFDPAKTTSMLKPVGKDSSLKTWQGDQWKIGGGTTWGWYSYDADLDMFYYGNGNPFTWNPVQRPGDNKWSMSLFGRDLDTGMAKWVYQ